MSVPDAFIWMHLSSIVKSNIYTTWQVPLNGSLLVDPQSKKPFFTLISSLSFYTWYILLWLSWKLASPVREGVVSVLRRSVYFSVVIMTLSLVLMIKRECLRCRSCANVISRTLSCFAVSFQNVVFFKENCDYVNGVWCLTLGENKIFSLHPPTQSILRFPVWILSLVSHFI